MHNDKPTDETSLGDARTWLTGRIDKGQVCPCCKQFAKVYKRPMTSSMAYGLILLARVDRDEDDGWVHIENYFKSLSIPSSIRGDITKLVNWGLLERFEGEREDGSNRVGLYRVTYKGVQFVRSEIEVYSHIIIYSNMFQGFSGEPIKIKEALGKKFNYDELMNS